MIIDPDTKFGARVLQRLQNEEVIWLTTVRADQLPQPSPVWFLWDGETFLIYSIADKPKLRNIARNSKVALNLNSDEHGYEVVVFSADARIDTDMPSVIEVEEYIQKYTEGIAGIDMTPESFAEEYTVAIRITPTHVRGL